MYKLLTVLCFLFLALPVHLAQAEDIDTEYNQMVALSKSMPSDYDFAKVRDLYTKTSFFSPYKTIVKIDFEKFFDGQKAGDDKAVKDMEKYVTANFALTEVHSRAATMYKTLNQEDQVAYHTWALRGLMRALLTSGTGKSAASAYKVVNVSEEYLVTRSIGKVESQRVDKTDGKVFDVLTMAHQDGSKDDVWFDITDVFGKGMP
jgi:hypothetical protein